MWEPELNATTVGIVLLLVAQAGINVCSCYEEDKKADGGCFGLCFNTLKVESIRMDSERCEVVIDGVKHQFAARKIGK